MATLTLSPYSLPSTPPDSRPTTTTSTPPCDACVRRKSRCAMNHLVNKCYSCDFHRQDCTFTASTMNGEFLSKKRKLDDVGVDSRR